MTSNAIHSPCINVCTLDRSGMCIGCGRLLQEVAQWSGMTPAQQLEVRQRAAERLERSRNHAHRETPGQR